MCSPSMLLFRQRMAALQPSAPHTSFLFLSPWPPSCFPSLRIKVTRSGWPIHWALDLSTPTSRNRGLAPSFQVVLSCVADQAAIKVLIPSNTLKTIYRAIKLLHVPDLSVLVSLLATRISSRVPPIFYFQLLRKKTPFIPLLAAIVGRLVMCTSVVRHLSDVGDTLWLEMFGNHKHH